MKDEEYINKVIDSAVSLLRDLATRYKFDFSLNFTAPLIGVNSGIICNDKITLETLDRFVAQIQDLRKELSVVPTLLDAGHTLVMCANDEGKPDNWLGDWVQKNQMYIVTDLLATGHGMFCYVLKGMTPKEPYQGYKCSRFVRVMSTTLSN